MQGCEELMQRAEQHSAKEATQREMGVDSSMGSSSVCETGQKGTVCLLRWPQVERLRSELQNTKPKLPQETLLKLEELRVEAADIERYLASDTVASKKASRKGPTFIVIHRFFKMFVTCVVGWQQIRFSIDASNDAYVERRPQRSIGLTCFDYIKRMHIMGFGLGLCWPLCPEANIEEELGFWWRTPNKVVDTRTSRSPGLALQRTRSFISVPSEESQYFSETKL